jgi:hypothetical protein
MYDYEWGLVIRKVEVGMSDMLGIELIESEGTLWLLVADRCIGDAMYNRCSR